MPTTKRTRAGALAIAVLTLLSLACLCPCSATVSQPSSSSSDPTSTPTKPPTPTPGPSPTGAAAAPALPQRAEAFQRPYAFSPEEAQGLSEDQKEVLGQLNWPQAFSLVWAEDTEGTRHWVETWHYFDIGTVFVFRDGAFHHDEPAEVVAEEHIVPTPYHPNQFKYKDMLPEIAWQEMEAPNQLFPSEVRFYAGEQILAGFREDKLFFAESIAILRGGE